MCRERVTRQLYYEQLKANLLQQRQLVAEERCFLLAAYSLQADHGNYSACHAEQQQPYFDAREYFPAWVRLRLPANCSRSSTVYTIDRDVWSYLYGL